MTFASKYSSSGDEPLDLGDQLLCTVVFDLGLMMDLQIIGCLQESRIEDLLLDRGVNLERVADLRGEFLLAVFIARLAELLEPVLDLAMIGFQKGDRVLRVAAPFTFRLCPCHVQFLHVWGRT